MKISELFVHVQIQVVKYLWCQIKPSITGLVLTLVLSALNPGYAMLRRSQRFALFVFIESRFVSYRFNVVCCFRTFCSCHRFQFCTCRL
jgi:hypothetical protein